MQELSTTHLTAWRGFITAHARLIERIDQELLTAGCISLQWYDVLVELVEAPGRRLRMSDLAAQVVLSRSTLTRLVDRLEAEGLLTRERSKTDRRGAYAVLTEQGLAAMHQAWPVYARCIGTYFAHHLSVAEAQALAAAFERVLHALPSLSSKAGDQSGPVE
jgi:DNA-binding MarR family transcriptional regulator